MAIDQKIIDFYNQSPEKDRLKFGLGPLELERNQALIERFLPDPCGTILDIGGGPGIYASWLAQKGFTVHLLDPVPLHIEQARKKANRLKNPFSAVEGSADALPFENESMDLVIMHGPLYHLQKEKDRKQALQEAKRVLKPGGVLMAWAITHMASTFVGLIQGLFAHEAIYPMCFKEIETGIHEAPVVLPGVLEKGFYHRPDQLKAEIEQVGLEMQKILPVEGIIWLDKNYFASRSIPQHKEIMMQLLEKTEDDAALLAISPHIVGVATKKD